MMNEIRVIDVRTEILSDNKEQADIIRRDLSSRKIYLVNLMASPGAGKTSLIVQTLQRLRGLLRMAVIEGDVESTVDSEKIRAAGFPAVQIRTGGACHLDGPMISAALKGLNLDALDMVIVENIGNLICPAEFDIGADLQAMILSVPEGDDKALKYPLMFSVCDVLLINKIDYLEGSDFNLERLRSRVQSINPRIRIFEISCKTGAGLDEWCQWLLNSAREKVSR